MFRTPLVSVALLASPALVASPAVAADWNQAPVNYDKATPDNAVSRLQTEIASGRVKLAHDEERGYLKATLDALKVPISSQVLVFSKTSFQRARIAPKTPRAIYFNDDVYIGYCVRGDVMEVSVADPTLGTVYYSLDQEAAQRPRFIRQTDHCLICHSSSSTRGFPGHLMRSVHSDRTGEMILGAGSHRTDDSSPFDERFGGWYVTGRHGDMEHKGNRVYRNRRDYDDPDMPSKTQNVTDLKPFFTTGIHLSPHSDIVALMVLTHQAAVHNRIARATLETRCALHYQDELNKALKEPAWTKYESVKGRISSVGDDLVKRLLFSEEAKLEGRVVGTSGFAKEFAARGPFDSKGRSLRQFDLATRLFKYPCSYLIYTKSFDAMPAEVRDYVLRKLHEVLTGKNTEKAFEHLSAVDRQNILEILRDTKPGLPDYWRK